MPNNTEREIILYHGSDRILEVPEFGKGELQKTTAKGDRFDREG